MRHYGVVHRRPGNYNHIARNMLGQLRAKMRTTNQRFGSWTRQLQDGTRITVQIIFNGVVPIYRVHVVPALEAVAAPVDVYGIFLESGAYKVQFFDGAYSAQYIIGDGIEAQYVPLVDWDGDGSITDADIVCPLQTIQLPLDPLAWPPAPFVGSLDPRGYEIAESQRGTSQLPWEAVSRVQASLFAGKMVLYVQSLYGSDREDVKSEYLGGSGSWPKLLVGDQPLGFRGTGSSILFTTSNYRYFLCTLSGDFDSGQISLTTRELVPYLDAGDTDYDNLVTAVTELRSTLVTKYSVYYDQPITGVPVECAITEAALLSLLAPSATVYQNVLVGVPSNSISYGSPFAYGWDATWCGAEASIVLITPDTLSFNSASRRLTLSLTGVVDGQGDPTFTGSIAVSPVKAIKILNEWMMWEPNGWDYSEFYVSVNFWMCGISEPGTVVPDGDEYFEGFEFYGWYDEADVWVPCSMSHINLGDTSLKEEEYVKPIFCQYGTDSQEFTDDVGEKLEIQHNITVGGHTLISVTQPGQRYGNITSKVSSGSPETDYQKRALDMMSGNRCYDYPDDFFPEYNIFQTYCWDVDWGIYDWEQDRVGACHLTGKVSAIVPFGTRKGLLYGRWHITSSAEKYHDYQETLDGADPQQQYAFELQKIKKIRDPCPPCCHEELWGGANFNQKSSNYANGQWNPNLVTSTPSGVDYSTSVQWFVGDSANVGLKVYDEGIGGAGDQSIWEIISGNMALVEATPPGGDNPSYSGDMSAFFEKDLICAGSRTLSIPATIMKSAVFASVATHSTSSAMDAALSILETDDGYTEDDTGFSYFDSFVGWS